MINNANINVFCAESERENVKEGLRKLFPFNLEDNKIILNVKKSIGFHENIIYCYSVFLKRRALAKKFVNHLISLIDDKEFILKTIESRLSEDLHFFLRIDKEEWINGNLIITDGGNCFHIDISMVAFPRKRESVISELKEMFE